MRAENDIHNNARTNRETMYVCLNEEKKGEKQLQPSVFRTSSVCKIYQRTVVLTDLDNRLRECFLADVLYRAPLPEQGLLVMSMGQVEVQVYKSRALVCSPGALAAVIHLT